MIKTMIHLCVSQVMFLLLVFVFALSNQGVTSNMCWSRKCPPIPSNPICGTDMKTHKNFCSLQEEACKTRKTIKIAHSGRCEDCADQEIARKLLIQHYFTTHGAACKKFGTPNERTLKMCLQMNFLKIDQTRRKFLKYKGFYSLFHKLKKYRKSKKCVKTLAKHCDSNKDKKITEAEFIGCFVTSDSSERTRTCTGTSSHFQCHRDGSYTPMQCVLHICYCSASDGNVLVHFKKEEKGNYDCDKVRKNWEDRKKLVSQCSESDKEDVISKYKINIEDEIIAKAPHVIKPKVTSIESFLSERGFRSMHTINKLLMWKFRQLDKNKDGILQDGELKVVKNKLRDISPSCTEPLLTSCNVNQDLHITKKEWRVCFGFKKNGAFVPEKKTSQDDSVRPTSSLGGCPPVAFCTLSCSVGFKRDKNGCITCKCRDFSSFWSTWKGSETKT